MSYLPAIFSLLVAAAGWFYMFYSKAASNLSGVEVASANRVRVRLRRIGGLAMMLLAIAFYAGFVALEHGHARAVLGFMLAVAVLMGVIVALGLADLHLTGKLRRSRRRRDRP